MRILHRRAHRRPPSGIALAIIVALVGSAGFARGESPEEKGLEIARETDRRDLGFGDSEATLKMVLMNREGQTSERELRMKVLENPDPNDGDHTLIVFDHPRDVKGTSLLTYTHILQSDDQWLYLPALKRVKRISSSNKSGPFMGSEFAYEDFSSQEVGKYSYKYLRDEACGALQCFVSERIPEYANSGYTRQESWVDQTEYRVQKVVYYDRKGSLLKTLVMSDYKQYLGKYWRAHDLFMENHQTGKKTRLAWSDYKFRVGLGDKDFSQNALKRQR